MAIQERFKGVGVAMITPFNEDGSIDFQSLGKMIDYVIEGGVDYIVALGTTAETPTLYIPERVEVAAFVTKHIASETPLTRLKRTSRSSPNPLRARMVMKNPVNAILAFMLGSVAKPHMNNVRKIKYKLHVQIYARQIQIALLPEPCPPFRCQSVLRQPLWRTGT